MKNHVPQVRSVTERHRRLAILRLLHAQPQYTSNLAVLDAALSYIGIVSVRDDIDQDCSWMATQHLVEVTRLDIGVVRVTSLHKGVEVAEGRVKVEGIATVDPTQDRVWGDVVVVKDPDRRLAVLRLLDEQPGRVSNTTVLDAALDALGHVTSLSDTREVCDWLANEELVVLVELEMGVVRVEITRRGSEVATDKRQVENVSRPSPR